MNSKHKHSELMMQYAKDASTHEFPYIFWQYNVSGTWHDLNKHPEWDFNTEYRRKPLEQTEMISVSGKFMKPLKKDDIKSINSEQFVYFPIFDWNGDFCVEKCKVKDMYQMSSKAFHVTEENAQKHVNFLNLVYRGE